MNKRIIYCYFQTRLVENALTLFYQQLKLTKVFNKKGYLYIYVNNTSMGKAVYFDDFKIIHKKFTFAKPIQLDDYYPFGMQTADSWVADNIDPNNYLFNVSSELNETTNNYQTFFRDYDPALGRMTGIDIMASKYSSVSPYNYAFNDPIGLNDPNGDDPYGEQHWYKEGGGDMYDPRRYHGEAVGGLTNSGMLFGDYAVGGTGDWANSVRSFTTNFWLMTRGQFLNYSGIVTWHMSDDDRYRIGRAIGKAPNRSNPEDVRMMSYMQVYRYSPYGGRRLTKDEWKERIDSKYWDEADGIYNFFEGSWTLLGELDWSAQNGGTEITAGMINDIINGSRVSSRELSKYIPVAVMWGLDGDFVIGAGSEGTASAGVILRGPDAGKWFILVDGTSYGPTAFGLDISATFEGTHIFYTGDVNQFNLKMLEGDRIEVSPSINLLGIEIGLNVFYGLPNPEDNGAKVIGVGGAFGVGVPKGTPISGGFNINYGKSTLIR